MILYIHCCKVYTQSNSYNESQELGHTAPVSLNDAYIAPFLLFTPLQHVVRDPAASGDPLEK